MLKTFLCVIFFIKKGMWMVGEEICYNSLKHLYFNLFFFLFSGNSLFAVPANQEFVYIFTSKPFITDFVGFVLNQIRAHCQMAKELGIYYFFSFSSILFYKINENLFML